MWNLKPRLLQYAKQAQLSTTGGTAVWGDSQRTEVGKASLLSTCFLGRDAALHSGVVNGTSPDPSVLQIPKEKGLGPPNNGPKLHRPVRHKP